MKQNSPTHHFLAEHILSRFPGKKPITIVDYGCGSGALLEYFQPKKIAHYYGLDVNQAGLVEAGQAFPKIKSTYKKITPDTVPTFGSKQSTDVVILIGVWQYLTDQERKQLLIRAYATLKKGGYLLISCAVDHHVYQWFNIYRHFVPHAYVSRKKLLQGISKQGFTTELITEKGFLFAPLFSNVISFFADAADYVLWRKKGTLGPIGQAARTIAHPLIALEFKAPLDYGYTLFVIARK